MGVVGTLVDRLFMALLLHIKTDKHAQFHGLLPLQSNQSIKYSLHSFIHSGDLYSASSRDYYSQALPAKSRTKKNDFREM